jgi:putative copper export protein
LRAVFCSPSSCRAVSPEWWSYAWGQGLTAKLALVAVSFALAAHHRFCLSARLENEVAGAGQRLARSIEPETFVAVLVVIATTVFASNSAPMDTERGGFPDRCVA